MRGKILKEIYSHGDKEKAKILSRFFKTGKGQYGEGDKFLGVTIPISRSIAIKNKNARFSEIDGLLKNKVHEVRLVGLLLLVHKYENANKKEKEKIARFYLKNTKYINNWDLVDLSAPKILGEYLFFEKDKNILLKLARSNNFWEQRIAILSTFAFVKKGELVWTFKIAKMFLGSNQDLIHKAVGWMLREAGKRNEKVLRKFLDANVKKMPRTMLRYAIERFPTKIRRSYLKK